MKKEGKLTKKALQRQKAAEKKLGNDRRREILVNQ
jgi:hypothetical protein